MGFAGGVQAGVPLGCIVRSRNYFVIYNLESKCNEIYQQKVLLVVFKASVSGLIRCAFVFLEVGVLPLQLAWTDYFDDYLSTSGPLAHGVQIRDFHVL